MKINKNGKLLIALISVFFFLITKISISVDYISFSDYIIRLFALWGLFFLLVASLMTPFLKEIYTYFGASFIKIHHIFAIAGIFFSTLHPLTFAIQQVSAAVFIPNFDTWIRFWELAGRPAFYLIYIASLAGVLRKKWKKSWRKIHVLMYLVLIFIIVHANLIGTDFTNLGISVIFNTLFGLSMIAMVYKQYQKFQRNKAKKIKSGN